MKKFLSIALLCAAMTFAASCDKNNDPDPDPIPKANVGDYFYADGSYSAQPAAGKTAIGIVFWVDPTDATKGKVVSMNEATKQSWDQAKTYAGSYGEGEKSWSFPTQDDLQQLFCTYIGVPAKTWHRGHTTRPRPKSPEPGRLLTTS